MKECHDHYGGPQGPPRREQRSGSVAHHRLEPRRNRRSHTKSRNGCQYCKRRRIKCDEVKPACGNCSRLSIPCNYVPPNSQPGTADLVVRRRGRPPKAWTVVPVPPETTSTCEVSTIPSSSSSLTLSVGTDWHVERPLHLPWDAEDLELFFHYLDSLCAGLGVGDTALWKDSVPRLAFRRHGVLHLLLASSALHLAREEPRRRRQLEERAEVHLAIGLRRATDILPNLSAGNCTELYVASILVCVCSLAKGPVPGNLLLVAEGSEVAWWKLFKGVRIVVETFGIPILFSGGLGPIPSEVEGNKHDEYPHGYTHHVNLTMVEWEDALGRLCTLISTCPSKGERDACHCASNMMMWCFQETYGTAANPKAAVDAKFNTIMAWFYCLSDEFIGYLNEGEPIPLILLAHFTVLLNTLDSVWFMNGWAAHVIRGVSDMLGPAWRGWLNWPTLQIERPREPVIS